MKRLLLYNLVFLLLINIVLGAVIHGSIYDISLNKVNNARIEVNTVPEQNFIVKNGTYSFNVPVGDYTISAVHYRNNEVDSFFQDNISVVDDGIYVLDIILFPNLDDVYSIENDFNELNIEEDIVDDKVNRIYYIVIGLLVIVVFIVVYYYRYKKEEKTEAKKEVVQEEKKDEKREAIKDVNDINKIVKIIKNEGGRITQKEIRKQIPLSEAKISLMIAELEHKGVVKKIKKGRGNIIILEKNEQ